jgi:hypothetical protein
MNMSVGNPQFNEGDKVTIKGIAATIKSQILENQADGTAKWGQVYAFDANGGLIIANPSDVKVA